MIAAATGPIQEHLIKTLKFFRWDFAIAGVALAAAWLYGGPAASLLAAILIVVELVFSFDNAAVNAKYLARLNGFWQRLFLTVGVLIAVFGMRLVFPFVVVCVAGSITPVEALRLAFEKGDPHQPGTYGYLLEKAHPSIAAFGGIFLLMLFLDFVFDTNRESTWLSWVERPLMRVGRLDTLSSIIALVLVLVASGYLAEPTEAHTVLVSGVAGVVTYLAVKGLATVMEEREAAHDEEFLEHELQSPRGQIALAGKGAFSLFLFLEVLDASFSFDGVIGAFAITPDPLIIAIGLGIGALFVRSMTVYLVRQGTLAEYRYLEHGAHWAIGSLALMLLISIRVSIPDITVGLIGICFIAAAWISSRQANARDASASTLEQEVGA